MEDETGSIGDKGAAVQGKPDAVSSTTASASAIGTIAPSSSQCQSASLFPLVAGELRMCRRFLRQLRQSKAGTYRYEIQVTGDYTGATNAWAEIVVEGYR